jgi:hypothetical protein
MLRVQAESGVAQATILRCRRMTGRPMEVVRAAAGPVTLEDQSLATHYRWGFAGVKLYMAYCFLVAMGGLALTLWRPGLLPRLRAAALAMPLAPVGMLIGQLLGARNLYLWLLASALATAVMAAVGSAFRRPALAIALAMLIGAGVVVADTLTGSWLVRTAPFAFPVMSGSRFYGLGNEYVGVLLGLSTVGLAGLLQVAPGRRWVFGLLGALIVLVIGAPFWGANWGGSVSAAAALVVVWAFSSQAPLWRRLLIGALLVLASGILPAALDLTLSAARQSHIGAAAAAVLSDGFPSVAATAWRKLAMSFGILTYTPWTIPLAAAGLAVFWVFLRRGSPARAPLREQRLLAGGILGAVIGGLAAVVVNDSGIVAGAGALVAAVSALLVVAGGPQEPVA